MTGLPSLPRCGAGQNWRMLPQDDFFRPSRSDCRLVVETAATEVAPDAPLVSGRDIVDILQLLNQNTLGVSSR